MAGVVKVVRVVRVRVILSEILKWQRFLEVISRFLEVISRFLEVISWFLEVISTRGRYRAARAAKKRFFRLSFIYCSDCLWCSGFEGSAVL